MGYEDKWRKVQDPVTKHENHRIGWQCSSKLIRWREKTQSLIGIFSVWKTKTYDLEQAEYKPATQSPVVQRPHTLNCFLRLQNTTLKLDDIRTLEPRLGLPIGTAERRASD